MYWKIKNRKEKEMVISMPRGTQDILPEESIKWQYIEGKLREISKNFCYE